MTSFFFFMRCALFFFSCGILFLVTGASLHVFTLCSIILINLFRKYCNTNNKTPINFKRRFDRCKTMSPRIVINYLVFSFCKQFLQNKMRVITYQNTFICLFFTLLMNSRINRIMTNNCVEHLSTKHAYI